MTVMENWLCNLRLLVVHLLNGRFACFRPGGSLLVRLHPFVVKARETPRETARSGHPTANPRPDRRVTKEQDRRCPGLIYGVKSGFSLLFSSRFTGYPHSLSSHCCYHTGCW